ncbi:hypothetical protein CEY12_20580 [Chryseobacterium sp. T16E-39]|uniref:hypothetical protein n=1 Tax=Chryseobacterium sp. T16E-39 TaxID=2015076 RepID=UPI000B5B45D2|nr:hypothetical protein [Chryseobacterium sp. T16E-39]ASK32330.1 hypothetical protein CEY12_20580 [Chryseobacterium sp. T16E-39]
MNKLINILFFVVCSITYSYAQCPNGDVEMNDFTNWQGYTGSNIGGNLNLPTFTSGITPTQHMITGVGSDPIVGPSLPTVAEGSHAIRLGNTAAGRGAEVLSYTFTAGNSLSFMYAVVLQGAHSDPEINGFFGFWISTSNTLANSADPGNLIYAPTKINANIFDSYFRTMTYAGEPLAWKEWQTACISIPPQYAGQQLTIYFATADCRDGGHFGYAYIDGLCKSIPPTPVITGPTSTCNIDDSLLFDGSTTTNESQYYWTAQECDIVGNPIGSETLGILTNGPVRNFSLRGNYTGLKSGHYYKVRLRVRNCGSAWIETYKIIKIDYPVLAVGNKVICCGSTVRLKASTTSPGNSSEANYKWYDENGNFIGNGMVSFSGNIGGPFVSNNQIPVTPTKSTKYRVVFEYNGCKNEEWIYVTLVQTTTRGAFSCVSYNNCTGSGTVKYTPLVIICGTESELGADYNFHMQQAINSVKYSWSTGSTSDTSYVTGNVPSTVTITSVCGSSTSTVNPPILTGAFPNLFIPNAMSMTNPFVIYNTMMNQLVRPAYNAFSYELSVYDRWGTRVYYKYEANCLGLYNGQIFWNGRYTPDANGNPGPYVNIPGVYSWYLKLTNCSGEKTFQGDVTFLQ